MSPSFYGCIGVGCFRKSVAGVLFYDLHCFMCDVYCFLRGRPYPETSYLHIFYTFNPFLYVSMNKDVDLTLIDKVALPV